MIKLSVIIPYYNTLELTKLLLSKLIPQLTDEVEVIVINNYDDTIFRNVLTLFCESNGTAGKPRNIGLNNAKGEYFTFIDSDDLIADNYIETILNKINTSQFDYCLFSWKYINKLNSEIIIKDDAELWNCSVWNCIYKNTNERFDETTKIAEDYDFNLRTRIGKKENIESILYYYNFGRIGSLTDGVK